MSAHDALLLAAADALAAWLHRDSRDKQKEPLVGHCRRVSATLREQGWPAEVQAAGLLHDVLELPAGAVYVSAISLDSLTELLGEDVSDPISHVTHDAEEETYREYIERLALEGTPEAIAVKLADLRDNLGPARPIPESLRKRYLKAVERLEAAGDSVAP